MTGNIKFEEKKIAAYCQKHQITKLAFFGSVLGDNFSAESDLDVLVEFEIDGVPGYFRLVNMAEELSALCGQHKIDLRTKDDLSRYFRDEVVASAEVIYVKE